MRKLKRDPIKAIELHLLSPRGFCAGVVRAIEIVELALKKWGPPIYVRHEIVHNRFVVEELSSRGVIFVKELDECPSDKPVVLSAHGVAKSVQDKANQRKMFVVDAVCPLVSKIHIQVLKNYGLGLQTIMIGHDGHPETVGTLGQLPPGEVLLVETLEDVHRVRPVNPEKLSYVTQTTLSVDDTAEIAAELKKRFPTIRPPHKSDICYATTNRQAAVKKVALQLDALVVVGSSNSSNSNRLVEVARSSGCPFSQLVMSPEDIDWERIDDCASVGLTSGASAPEELVTRIRSAFDERYQVTIMSGPTVSENVVFKLPSVLRSAAV